MAKQTINLGTSANKGDGDPLRTAFDKVNDNFDEVYGLLGATGGDTDDVIAPMLVHSNHTNVTVTRDDDADQIIFSVDQAVTDLKGSVFADDSTLLVDGVAGKIVGNVDATLVNATTVTTGSVYSSYFTADGTSGAQLTIAAAQNLSGAGGSVFIRPGVGTTTDGKIILDGDAEFSNIVYMSYLQGGTVGTPATLNINGDVDFGNAGNIDLQGSTLNFLNTTLNNLDIPFTPANPVTAATEWDGNIPTTLQEAVDRIATVLFAQHGPIA